MTKPWTPGDTPAPDPWLEGMPWELDPDGCWKPTAEEQDAFRAVLEQDRRERMAGGFGRPVVRGFAMRSEAAMIATFAKQLSQVGAVFLKVHGHAMQAPGWPDFYIAHARWSGWVEAKREGERLAPIQVAVVRRLVHAQVNVAVIRPSTMSAWLREVFHP